MAPLNLYISTIDLYRQSEHMNQPSIIIRAFVGVLLITSLIISLSTCAADDACRNYEDHCPDIDEALCVGVLRGQRDKVIHCV